MPFSKEENDNIVSLLLHIDQANLEVALSILEYNEEAVNATVIYALNILSLLSIYNIPYEQRPKRYTKKDKVLKDKIEMHERITRILQAKIVHLPQLKIKTLPQDIFIFALRNMPEDEQGNWEKWWRKYQIKRKDYEPLLLQNPHWHEIYKETIGFLYAQSAYKEAVDLADAFLAKAKHDDDMAYIRYLALGHLIGKGEAKHRLPQQIEYSLHGLAQMPKYTHCMYNFFLGNDYYLFEQYTKARDYYLAAWDLRNEDLRYSRGVYAALAAHRLSALYYAQIELNEERAYFFAKAAYELKTNIPNITANWAYWLWKYKNQVEVAKDLLEGLMHINVDFILPKFYLFQIEWKEQNGNIHTMKKSILSLLSHSIYLLRNIKNQLLPVLYEIVEILHQKQVYPDLSKRILEIISEISD